MNYTWVRYRVCCQRFSEFNYIVGSETLHNSLIKAYSTSPLGKPFRASPTQARDNHAMVTATMQVSLLPYNDLSDYGAASNRLLLCDGYGLNYIRLQIQPSQKSAVLFTQSVYRKEFEYLINFHSYKNTT